MLILLGIGMLAGAIGSGIAASRFLDVYHGAPPVYPDGLATRRRPRLERIRQRFTSELSCPLRRELEVERLAAPVLRTCGSA